jgi:monoamine oxidase
MLDTAIIGGGLSGLALASLLHTRNIDLCVFEARERLGGRVLTLKEPPRLMKDARGLTRELSGLTLDCGPTWFWPDDNPRLSRLLGALGIATFSQYETGRLVFAPAATAPPRREPAQPVYASAKRVVGGVGALVEALARRMDAERIRVGHQLVALAQQEDFVELTFDCRGSVEKLQARRVVLAMPPRLVHERIEFSPALPAELRDALAATPTWMASRAKALSPFPSPFWRAKGDSGAALAPYPGAVLGEVFDACDANDQPALGGFFGLGSEEREAQRETLGELVQRQLTELFGPFPEGAPEPRIQDWATERFTTSALDLEQPALEPTGAPALVRQPFWRDRLFIAGTETAVEHPGHLEGALEAALRVAPLLMDSQPKEPARPQRGGPKDAPTEAWLKRFRGSMSARKSEASAVYQEAIQRALSTQFSDNMTQSALLQAVATVYRGALSDLASAPFAHGKLAPSAVGEHVEEVIAPLARLGRQVLTDALRFNQTSCAMRAFPQEARPDDDYLRVIRTDLESMLEEVKRRVEQRLAVKSAASRERK